MKFAHTNNGPGIDGKPLGKGKAFVVIEGTEAQVREVLEAAIAIRDKPDPVLQEIVRSLKYQANQYARETAIPPYRYL